MLRHNRHIADRLKILPACCTEIDDMHLITILHYISDLAYDKQLIPRIHNTSEDAVLHTLQPIIDQTCRSALRFALSLTSYMIYKYRSLFILTTEIRYSSHRLLSLMQAVLPALI